MTAALKVQAGPCSRWPVPLGIFQRNTLHLPVLLALLLLPAAVAGQIVAPPADSGPGIRAVGAQGPFPPDCPRAGVVVERGPLPSLNYRGVAAEDPALCIVNFAGTDFPMYFGIWAKAWPGASDARVALDKVIHGPTGTTASFDTRMMPGSQWHEVIRNDGVEDLNVFGQIRTALKISHYREGFEGNTYRSVVTGWKDMRTGAMIYVNYRHISGRPEVGTAWDATGLVEPR